MEPWSKIVKEWLYKRKLKRSLRRFKKGYGFAMTAYFVQGIGLTELQGYSELVRDFNDYDDFDSGVDHAIAKLKRVLGNRVRYFDKGDRRNVYNDD